MNYRGLGPVGFVAALAAGACIAAAARDDARLADALYRIGQAQDRGAAVACRRGYQTTGFGRTAGAYPGTYLATEDDIIFIPDGVYASAAGRKLQQLAQECVQRGETK